MTAVLLLLIALASVDASVRHTVESYSTTDHGMPAEHSLPCINDCVNRKCKVLQDSGDRDCTPGNKIAPKYFTAQAKSNEPLCLSRCGRFGESYDWCYVSEDLTWDYCSSETTRTNVTHEFTLSSGPCKSKCAKDGRDFYWCYNFWGDDAWDKCKPGIEYTYTQCRTHEGEMCIGECKSYDDTQYLWCKTLDGWGYCAPPAISVYEASKHGSCQDPRMTRYNKYDWNINFAEMPGYFENLALTMENHPDLSTTTLTDGSVYRYTVRNPVQQNEPVLPVVVRARITPQTVAQPNSRPNDAIPYFVRRNLERIGMIRNQPDNNNDEAGHLIAYMNGGPSELYNFAPQTRRLNRGTNDNVISSGSIWLTDEFEINQWARAGGEVDQTVVVLYDISWSRPSRPAGFGTILTYINPDGITVNKTCPAYFFSNDPNE